MKKHVVVIIGMHRSGTSLLSAGLSAIGLQFGAELMGGTAFNLKGHWEDNDIVAFNNRLLSTFGMRWDSTTFIDASRWKEKEVVSLVDEGIRLLSSKLQSNGNSFAFKDPRTVRVLPIWLQIFKRLEVSPQFIMPFRNPLDVGVSLAQREGKPLSLSQLLWMHHHFNYLVELAESDYPIFLVDFYDFCKDPGKTLNALANWLSLKPENSGVVDFVNEFYDPKLITKMTDPYQLSENKKLMPWIFDCYRKLRLIQGESSASSKVFIGEESEKWLKVGPYLCEQYNILASELLSSQEAALKQEREKSEELMKEISALEKERDAASKKLEGIENGLSEFSSKRLNQLADNLSKSNKFSKIETLNQETVRQLDDLSKRFNELERKLDRNDKFSKAEKLSYETIRHLKELTNQFNELSDMLRDNDKYSQVEALGQESIQRLFDLNKKVSSNNSYLEVIQKSYDEGIRRQEVTIAELRNEAERSRTNMQNIQKTLNNQRKRVNGILNSVSWKITAPLRWLGELLK